MSSPGLAIDLYWDNLGGGLSAFNNANFWSLDPALTMPAGAAPGAADNAFFGVDATYSVILGAPSAAANVTFTNGDVELQDVGGSVLNSGGVVTIDDVFAVGLGDGARVTLNAANWDNVGDARVGDAGFGSFSLNTSGDFRSQDMFIGNQVGSVGVVNVDGAGTTLQTDGLEDVNGFFIGNAGTGTLNVTGGGLARIVNDVTGGIANFELGFLADGEGTLNISGAGSQVIAEEVLIGRSGTGHLSITAGGVLNQNISTSPVAFVAANVDSSGDVTVSGDGSQWLMARLEIGNLGDGTLSVEAGGFVRSNSNDMALGDAGGSGRVAVFGSGASNSTLQVTNDLYVGSNGLGVLHVGEDLMGNADGNGTLTIGSDLRIGANAANAADNKVVLDGANVNATVGDVVFAGENGKGTLELRNGATLAAARPRVGSGANANGTLLVTGGGTTMTATVDTVIGTNGTGNAAVSDGAVLINAGDFWVGYQGNAVGTLTIDDATVSVTTSNAGNLQIGGRTDGSGGTGTLTVQNGGLLNVSDETYIGGNSTASGTLIVTGLGSTYFHKDGSVNDLLRIGYGGEGFAEVRDGGRIDAEGIVIGSLAGSAQANLLVTGSNSGTPSTVDIDGFLYVGDARKGTMTVEQGARVRVATSDPAQRLFIGDDNAADGSRLTVTDSGSRVDYHGTGDVSVGNAGGSLADPAILEVSSGGVFSAVQRNPDQSIASQARIIIGDVTGGNGRVLVDGPGSLVEASVIYVGDGDSSSSGILDISNGGGATTTAELEVGSFGSGVGTVNVDGPTSALSVGTYLSLGDDTFGGATNGATGTLNITKGATVTNGGQAFIGHFTGSIGFANIGNSSPATSSWTIGGELTLAGTETSSQTSGSGTLTVNTSGRVEVASNLRIRNLGDVNLSGGEIAVGDQLLFTDAGSTFNFNSGTLRFTNAAGHTLNAAQLDGILGINPTLGPNQHLAVAGTAVLSAPLRLNGGTFSVGSITAANMLNLDFDAGTFNLTNANLTVGAGGIFGAQLVIDPDQTINVTNQATIIAGAEMIVAGGFSSGQLTNNGELVAIDATIGGSIVNNNNVTVVGTVDFDGLVSGPGDFFGPGTANFNGGLAPGSSPAEVKFDGSVSLADTNTLFIEIAGTTLGDDYDSLAIVGSADLDGLLSVSLDGFTPTIGQQFTILTAGNITDHGLALGGPAASSFDMLIGSTSIILQAIGPTVPGDFDGDGDVDGADFVAWQTHFPTSTGAILADGDADGDGDVDGADFVVWQTNFPFTPAPGSSSIPEPPALMIVASAALALIVRFRLAPAHLL